MIDGVNGAGTNISGYVDSVSWPQTTDTYDTSTFGSAPKSFIAGQTDGDQISMSGKTDPAILTILYAVKAAQAAGSSTSSLVFGPAGSVATYTKNSAEVWIGTIGNDAGVAGTGTWSVSLQVTGAVTNTVW